MLWCRVRQLLVDSTGGFKSIQRDVVLTYVLLIQARRAAPHPTRDEHLRSQSVRRGQWLRASDAPWHVGCPRSGLAKPLDVSATRMRRFESWAHSYV